MANQVETTRARLRRAGEILTGLGSGVSATMIGLYIQYRDKLTILNQTDNTLAAYRTIVREARIPNLVSSASEAINQITTSSPWLPEGTKLANDMFITGGLGIIVGLLGILLWKGAGSGRSLEQIVDGKG